MLCCRNHRFDQGGPHTGLLQTPKKLSRVARRIPASSYAVFEVAAEMFQTEQIR